MTLEVTKENPHIVDHQNVLEARILDGILSIKKISPRNGWQ